MRTFELTGVALDWAVAKCEGNEIKIRKGCLWIPTECYSTDWAQGGPIIEREKIQLGWVVDHWEARKDFNYNKCFTGRDLQHSLAAAMRCYVASKLGDTVEVPAELLK